MNYQNPELFLEASNEAIFITNRQVIVSCNELALDLFAYNRHTITGMQADKLFVPEVKDFINKKIKEGIPFILETEAVTNNQLRFDVQLQIKPVTSADKTLVSFTVRDISNFKRSQQRLLAKDALLQAVSFAAAKFLESKNWRQEINPVLQYIGESAKVSRVYIFQNFWDEQGNVFMGQKYEWVADGIEAQIDNPLLQKLYYEKNGLKRLVDVLSKGDVVKGLVNNFSNNEREVLEAQGIISIYLTPIFCSAKWWGFIGYDECAFERVWNQNEIQLLNTVADIFNSALEQEKMEMEMAWTNQNFRSLFNNSPDGIYVYDYFGFILDANEAAFTLNGLRKEQILKKHVSELVPHENAKQVSADFKKWTTGELQFVESELITHKGIIYPVEIRGTRMLYFNTPAVVLHVRDISRRNNAEMQLKKRLEFIQFISQISSDFIKIDIENIEDSVDKALEFVCRFTSNERAYVFLINETQTGMILANEYCHPDFKTHKGFIDSIHVEDFPEFLKSLKNGEHILTHVDEIPDNPENTKRHQIFDLLQIKSSINIPLIVGGHFLGFIGFDSTTKNTIWDNETINAFMLTGQIISNILVRKKNENEIIEAKNKAEQSDKLKTAFLGQISHEMRTPLNSIIGFADLLLKELTEDEYKEMVDFILMSGMRLLNTFNLIIDLSEIEANVVKAKLEAVDLRSFINGMLPLFKRRAIDKNLEFEYSDGKCKIEILADESLLEKILNNLVDNALKYTRQGNILLDLSIEEVNNIQMAVISIKDTGIGIQKDKITQVFSNFRQASEGYNREFEGAGLGLSVTRGLVQLMDGDISVVSELNKGSDFRVIFPLLATPNQTINQNTSSPVLLEGFIVPPKILVIEDELFHQKYLGYILKDEYELTYAESGCKGLEIAQQQQFDLIIMDINLGKDLNGIEVLTRIKTIKGYKKIPVLAATANVMKGHKELFLSKGFTHYIPKPFKADELKALVDKILKTPPSNQ